MATECWTNSSAFACELGLEVDDFFLGYRESVIEIFNLLFKSFDVGLE